MENDWVKVFVSTQEVKALIIQGMLEGHGIASTVMNKRDSELFFGDVELYVLKQDESKAKKLIDEQNEPE